MTYRHRVATVFLFGFFLDLINMFIASIAFPAIGRALAVSVSQLAWVSNAYILGLTAVVPFSAWLSQRWGAKRLFLLSLGLFSSARWRQDLPTASANSFYGGRCRGWAAGC